MKPRNFPDRKERRRRAARRRRGEQVAGDSDLRPTDIRCRTAAGDRRKVNGTPMVLHQGQVQDLRKRGVKPPRFVLAERLPE